MYRLAYLKNFGNTPGHINHWSTRVLVDFVGKEFEVKEVKTPLPWSLVLVEKKS